MKIVNVPVPDSLEKHLKAMVKQGLFDSEEAAMLFAFTAFVKNPEAMVAQFWGFEDFGSMREHVREHEQKRKTRATPAANAPLKIYQLKITLEDIKPQVWRRFQTRSDTKLTRLHSMLLDIMGWSGYHLYEFDVAGLRYTDPEELEEDISDRGLHDASKTVLSQVVGEVGDKIRYAYDFGDGWRHTIKLEKMLDPVPGEKYPICLAGARSCPPEDCGGPEGYADLLKTLADPGDPDHEEMKEWAGPHFDPERFELELINRDMWRRVVLKARD